MPMIDAKITAHTMAHTIKIPPISGTPAAHSVTPITKQPILGVLK